MCTHPLNLSDRTVKCGQCKTCLQARSYEWANRLEIEARNSTSGYFLTLTYDNENVPTVDIIFSGGHLPKIAETLVKRDIQLFMKRLRKENEKYISEKERKIRYYLVGEYGGQTKRPHYHVLLFNANAKTLEKLNQIWNKGFVDIGTLTSKSIRYVSNYMLTKNIDYHPDLQKPFSLMSRRPGIGFDYVKENWLHHANHLDYKMKLPGDIRPNLPRYYETHVISEKQKESIRKLKQSDHDKVQIKVHNAAEKADPLDPIGHIRREKKHKEYIKTIRAKKRKL